MDISKISFKRNGDSFFTQITYTKDSKAGQPEEHTLKTADVPSDGFRNAMQFLALDVNEITEQRFSPKEAQEKIEVRWIKFSRHGAIISSERILDKSPQTLVLKTPHRYFEKPADDSIEEVVFSKAAIERINDLVEIAKVFVKGGERAQPTLAFSKTG